MDGTVLFFVAGIVVLQFFAFVVWTSIHSHHVDAIEKMGEANNETLQSIGRELLDEATRTKELTGYVHERSHELKVTIAKIAAEQNEVFRRLLQAQESPPILYRRRHIENTEPEKKSREPEEPEPLTRDGCDEWMRP